MKMKVVVDDRTFEVEVGSLSERPVVAMVDGERFEVWPEGELPGDHQAQPGLPAPDWTPPPAPQAPGPVLAGGPGTAAKAIGVVLAPIPGVIQAVAVREGDVVALGQELCVLEAMKMKNVIKASRAGEIGRVCVTTGQHVRHRDVLVEYAD